MAKVVVKRAAGMIAEPKPQDGGVVLALVSAGCSGSLLAEAASRLSEALAACTPVASIGGRAAAERIGRPVDEAASGEMIGWLSQLEGEVVTVILEADAEDAPWTRFCRRQADRLILVAGGSTAPLLLQRAAMVGSAQAVERVRSSGAVYLRPAVGTCNVLDWGRHAVMLEAGYDCARAALPAWAAARAEAG